MIHSRARPARMIAKRSPDRPAPDPYAPGSPDYTERHRTRSYQIASGIVREDMGAPVNMIGVKEIEE